MMKRFNVYVTDTFKKVYSSLDKSEQLWIDKTKGQLEENSSGKIIRFSWFREKKFGNKRLFYLVDEQYKKILFVAFASKKQQQKIIDFIIANMQELLGYLRSL